MTDSLKGFSTRASSTATTPAFTKAAKGQVKNNEGAYVFKIDDLERAKRFLILGSESNFYKSGQKLTKENAKGIIKLAEASDESSKLLVDLIVEISTAGRAPKQNPAIFALAIAASHGSVQAKGYALAQLPAVLRTGTSLFLFAGYVEQFRGWGRGLKNAVGRWYTEKDVDKLAYQAVKYQNREGYSHRDLLRLSHPESASAAFRGLGEWILRGNSSEAPRIVQGFVAAHAEGADLPALVREYGLSWEMLPTEALNSKAVWGALLDGNVPIGALLRQLPRLTRVGLLDSFEPTLATVVARLTDQDELVRGRIHPLQILVALKTYNLGASLRGSSTWTPVPQIVDALDKAFYLAFKAVEPANKRTMIGLDISSSMTWGEVAGSPITPREASAALALVTMATEPMTKVVGFSHQLIDIDITPRMLLDQVISKISNLPFGGTNAELPIQKAIRENLKVDTFIIITDNDTHGSRHVFEVLKEYRKKSGIDAKLIVLATEAEDFSVADPSDSGSLDIAGFDSATPALVADFSRGL